MKNIVDNILLKLKVSDLVENNETVSLIFNQETNYCLEPRVKVKIGKIIKTFLNYWLLAKNNFRAFLEGGGMFEDINFLTKIF